MHDTQKNIVWGIGLLLCMVSARLVGADSPTEEFYFSASDIHAAVLEETVGILSLQIFGEYADTPQKTAGSPAFRYFRPKGTGISGSSCVPKTPECEERVDVATLYPVSGSGWSWGDTLMVRVPIVKQQGTYRHIVYDAHRNRRTWINLADMSAFLQVIGEQSLTEGPVQEPFAVEFFFLHPETPRKLFQLPDKTAPFRMISPLTPVFEEEGERGGTFQYLNNLIFVTEIREGFAFLCEVDVYESGVVKPVGWLPVRDEDKRLTLWPVLPLPP